MSCLQQNCDSLLKLCRLQRINISCRIVCSAAKLWFAAETMSSVATWHSLPNGVFCSKFVIRCRNWVSTWVFSNEIVIRCRNCVGCSELTFTAETELSAAKLWFTAETVSAAANEHSLPKLSCLQRTSFRCRISNLQQTSFHCRIGRLQKTSFAVELAAYSEPVFAAELAACRKPASLSNWQPTANQFSLPNWPPAENQLRCRIGSLQRTSFRC